VAGTRIEAERLRTALELAELSERMLRQKLRRERPRLAAEQIERLIDEWYARRPGAPHGDGDGEPRGDAA
jgi:hypothetical protein